MRLALALSVLLTACAPDLGAPASLVSGPRLLAIQSEPAEVPPDHAVTLTALVVDPDGTLAPDVAWGLCDQPAPLSDNTVVSVACVRHPVPLPDHGGSITATVPITACSTFGPTPPAPEPGQPPRRPHDADVTGGYYQPVLASAPIAGGDALAGVGLTRIKCDLANAPLDVVMAFRARYQLNQNPRLTHVVAQLPGEADARELPAELPAGTPIPLRVRWTADSAEAFPVFDPQSRALVDHREAIRVSWFVTGGELASERTGRTEDDLETFADNVWTTPEAGPAHLWVVVRDSRGGLAFAGFDLTITP